MLDSNYTAFLPAVPWSHWGFSHLWLSLCPIFSAWNSLPSDILMVLMDHSLKLPRSERPSLSSYRIVLPAPHFFYPPNNLVNFLLFSSTMVDSFQRWPQYHSPPHVLFCDVTLSPLPIKRYSPSLWPVLTNKIQWRWQCNFWGYALKNLQLWPLRTWNTSSYNPDTWRGQTGKNWGHSWAPRQPPGPFDSHAGLSRPSCQWGVPSETS